MAYSKTTWANGDTITAEKLNNLEDGVAANDAAIGGMKPVDLAAVIDGQTGDVTIPDVTAAELFAMLSAGSRVNVTATGSSVEITLYCYVVAQEISGDDPTYDFAMVRPDGKIFVTGHLSATDPVVFSVSE